MIIVDCIQGSDEWFAARLGIPTASNFGKIITSLGKPSTSKVKYADQLLADWLAGKPIDAIETSYWMNRGTELEQQARDDYTFKTDNEVEPIGFAYLDVKEQVGASPDGLIGDDGIQEIKCPKGSTLVGYYGKPCPAKYYPQVQGELWVTGREWCDFYAWHPELMPYLIRVKRDESYIKLMAEEVEKFVKYLKKRKSELKGWKV